MKKTIFSIVALLASVTAYSQYPADMKCDYTWTLGYSSAPDIHFGNIILRFNNSSVDTSYFDGNVYYYLEGTSVSDSAGNLLLQCNGFAVYDSAFNKVPGADSLNCCNWVWIGNYNQGYPIIDGVTIVKRPGSDNEYWVINKAVESAVVPVQYGICYALRLTRIINNNNTYTTSVRDTLFYKDSIYCGSGMMELCRHANGRDWWLIQRDYYSNTFFIFLVDPSGIHLTQSQLMSGYVPPPHTQAVFSPDGSKFIIAGMYNEFNDSLFIARFNFDRCTGTLSNPQYLYWKEPINVVSSGCAISANSKFLYVASTYSVFQFDLDAVDWKSTKSLVATWDGFADTLVGGEWVTTFARMQLAPDNKIYITAGNTTYLHTIESPNESGISCNILQHSFKLPAVNARTMPNFPNYRLGPIDGSACDTLGIDNLTNINDKLDNNTEPVKLYPNPATDYITLFVPRITKQWQFALYDITGKEVFKNQSRGAFRSYNINHLTPGIYLWKLVYEDGKVENGKMVKQ